MYKNSARSFCNCENQCIAPRPAADQLWNWFHPKQRLIPPPNFYLFFPSTVLSLFFRHCIHFLSPAPEKHGFPTTWVPSSSTFLLCFTASPSVAFLPKYTEHFQKMMLGTEIHKTVSRQRDVFNGMLCNLSSLLPPLTFPSSLGNTLPALLFSFSK